MAYLLAIDLGTSSVKVALVTTETLAVVAVATEEYPVQHPQRGYAEQEPAHWWKATATAVRHVIANAPHGATVIGVGLSGQMHGIVCLDEDNAPLGPAIIWADTRSQQQVNELAAHQVQARTDFPGPPAVGFAAATFRWLHQNQPDTLARTHRWCLPKDYLRYRMVGGEIATEPSDASATWLYDMRTSDWSDEALALCGLTRDQMPTIHPSAAVSGTITDEAAQQLGIASGIPVVYGSADLPAQGLGHGVIDPDTLLLTVGSGGQIFIPTHTPTPASDNSYYLFRHNLAGASYVQAAMLAAGLSLRWLRDTLGMKEQAGAYAQLSEMAARVDAGAEGLVFLPYLTGERSPHMDGQASGLFLGLRLHHTPAHMARAVMEGVAFALKDCMTRINAAPQRVILSGGAAESPVWTQILADVLGYPLDVAHDDTPHGCIGAAILAGVGVGYYTDSADAIARQPHDSRRIIPQAVPIYTERFDQYQRLYPLLRDEMHTLYQQS